MHESNLIKFLNENGKDVIQFRVPNIYPYSKQLGNRTPQSKYRRKLTSFLLRNLESGAFDFHGFQISLITRTSTNAVYEARKI